MFEGWVVVVVGGISFWCSVAWSCREGLAAAVPGAKKMLLGGRKRGRERQRQRGELLRAMTKKNYSRGGEMGSADVLWRL